MKKKILISIAFFIFFQKNLMADHFIILQSTTSTRDSGLYEFLLPKFKEEFGFDVRVISVGTGQAIRNARRCDADVLIVHDKQSEESFVSQGFGLFREEFMYNDYVLVGPKSDPAVINEGNSIGDALRKISDSKSNFISRGDDSGTHKKEVELWKLNKFVPSPKKDEWYFEVGQGMGGTLNVAVNKNAYVLTDRSTWVSFNNKQDHRVLLQNEPLLKNFYGVIPLNRIKCPKVKSNLSEEFVNWITSKNGKKLINSFKVNDQQLFFSVD